MLCSHYLCYGILLLCTLYFGNKYSWSCVSYGSPTSSVYFHISSCIYSFCVSCIPLDGNNVALACDYIDIGMFVWCYCRRRRRPLQLPVIFPFPSNLHGLERYYGCIVSMHETEYLISYLYNIISRVCILLSSNSYSVEEFFPIATSMQLWTTMSAPVVYTLQCGAD